MWSQDIQHLPGKLNSVADLLSRPNEALIGTAYKLEAMDALQETFHEKDESVTFSETEDRNLVRTENKVLLDEGAPVAARLSISI